MKLVYTLIFVIAQRIPLVRSLPWVRNRSTIDAAISSLTKAVQQMLAVEAARKEEAKRLEDVIQNAREQKTAALADAARAGRVAGNINDLLV